MAGRHESLRREVAVGELVAEEHADDGGGGEGAENPALLGGREAKAREIAEDQGIPRPPDHELQHHHQKQLEADGRMHGRRAS
jgi:hypothetical protein